MLSRESRRRWYATVLAFGVCAIFGFAPGLGSEGLAEPPSALAHEKPIPVEPCNGIGPPGDCRDEGPCRVEPCDGPGAPCNCMPTISDLQLKNGSINYTLSEQVPTVVIRISWRDSSGASSYKFSGPGKAGVNTVVLDFKEQVVANRFKIVVRVIDHEGNVGRAAITRPVPDRFSR